MNVLKLKWIAVLFAALFIASCSDDDNNEDPKIPLGTKTVKELASKGFNTWRYYSFEKGFAEPVGIGQADPESGDDVKWAKRTDWDIAFNRYQIRTNGGASGNGKGGTIIVKENATTTDFLSLKEAPKSGYISDDKRNIMYAMPPKNAMVGMSSVSAWVTEEVLDLAAHKIKTTIVPTLFVLKTANGKYVKVYIKNYKNAKGKTGFITFDYVYQKDGSTSF